MSADDVLVTVQQFGTRSDDYLRGFEEGIAAYKAALRAAGYVVEQGWQDISTAPRDGTMVLVGKDVGQPWGFNQGTGYWVSEKGIEGWISRGIFDSPGNLGLGNPTHWRPLPAPPG